MVISLCISTLSTYILFWIIYKNLFVSLFVSNFLRGFELFMRYLCVSWRQAVAQQGTFVPNRFTPCEKFKYRFHRENKNSDKIYKITVKRQLKKHEISNYPCFDTGSTTDTPFLLIATRILSGSPLSAVFVQVIKVEPKVGCAKSFCKNSSRAAGRFLLLFSIFFMISRFTPSGFTLIIL